MKSLLNISIIYNQSYALKRKFVYTRPLKFETKAKVNFGVVVDEFRSECTPLVCIDRHLHDCQHGTDDIRARRGTR